MGYTVTWVAVVAGDHSPGSSGPCMGSVCWGRVVRSAAASAADLAYSSGTVKAVALEGIQA